MKRYKLYDETGFFQAFDVEEEIALKVLAANPGWRSTLKVFAETGLRNEDRTGSEA